MDDIQAMTDLSSEKPETGSTLFGALVDACADDWQAYVQHDFVRQLGNGSLPETCFRHYLTQDYIFLKHFARAYALAVYKSETLEDMRQAAATLDALINSEMKLHIDYCGRWGLTESDMAGVTEAPANMAYTRFVLERGMAGDLLDLLVALAPCVLGYGEIGARLLEQRIGPPEDNPYRDWIDTYGGADYQDVCIAALEQLERIAQRRVGADVQHSNRWPALVETFRAATRLEIGFWDMGLAPPG